MSNDAAIDAALKEAVTHFVAKRPKTKAWHERARAVMPGGNTRTVLFTSPFPIRIEKAEGSFIQDVDGHRYSDFVGEYSAGLFGHSHPRILEAVNEALTGGLNMGAHHVREVKFAEVVAKRFDLESLRFTNSGTEANMMALAVARCFTKRNKIMPMMGGYHGGTFYFGGGPSAVNAPFDCVLGRFNDSDATRRLIHQHADELAAIIVEPMLGSGGCIAAAPEFLQMLRHESRKAGIVLIFDEVMTSRLHPGGLSAKLGIQPDMKTLGKYIGGGMSFGAFGGRGDIMSLFDPTQVGALPHAGTFNNNTLTMTTGHAALTEIYTAEACVAHNVRAEKLKAELNGVFMVYQSPMQVTGLGSLLNFHPLAGSINQPETAVKGDMRLKRLLFLHLLEAGIYVAERGYMALSLMLTDDQHADLVKAVEKFVVRYRPLISN